MRAELSSAASGGWRACLLPSLVLAFSLVLVGALEFYPHPTDPVVVFFAPGVTERDTLLAAINAGANIIGKGVSANSLVVQSDDPHFFQRLHQSGVWLIADAIGKSGCGAIGARIPQ